MCVTRFTFTIRSESESLLVTRSPGILAHIKLLFFHCVAKWACVQVWTGCAREGTSICEWDLSPPYMNRTCECKWDLTCERVHVWTGHPRVNWSCIWECDLHLWTCPPNLNGTSMFECTVLHLWTGTPLVHGRNRTSHVRAYGSSMCGQNLHVWMHFRKNYASPKHQSYIPSLFIDSGKDMKCLLQRCIRKHSTMFLNAKK